MATFSGGPVISGTATMQHDGTLTSATSIYTVPAGKYAKINFYAFALGADVLTITKNDTATPLETYTATDLLYEDIILFAGQDVKFLANFTAVVGATVLEFNAP